MLHLVFRSYREGSSCSVCESETSEHTPLLHMVMWTVWDASVAAAWRYGNGIHIIGVWDRTTGWRSVMITSMSVWVSQDYPAVHPGSDHSWQETAIYSSLAGKTAYKCVLFLEVWIVHMMMERELMHQFAPYTHNTPVGLRWPKYSDLLGIPIHVCTLEWPLYSDNLGTPILVQ